MAEPVDSSPPAEPGQCVPAPHILEYDPREAPAPPHVQMGLMFLLIAGLLLMLCGAVAVLLALLLMINGLLSKGFGGRFDFAAIYVAMIGGGLIAGGYALAIQWRKRRGSLPESDKDPWDYIGDPR